MFKLLKIVLPDLFKQGDAWKCHLQLITSKTVWKFHGLASSNDSGKIQFKNFWISKRPIFVFVPVPIQGQGQDQFGLFLV